MFDHVEKYERLKAEILNEKFSFESNDPARSILERALFEKQKNKRLLNLGVAFLRPKEELDQYKNAVTRAKQTIRQFRTARNGSLLTFYNHICNKLEGFN
jgi:hypothetical protein